MSSSVEATLVGGLLPLFSQYRTERGGHPAARASSACVSPASIRAARIWRPETMLLMTAIYIRFWKRRHGSPALSKARRGSHKRPTRQKGWGRRARTCHDAHGGRGRVMTKREATLNQRTRKYNRQTQRSAFPLRLPSFGTVQSLT